MLPADGALRIAQASEAHGELRLRHNRADELYVVTGIEFTRDAFIPVSTSSAFTALHEGDDQHVGQWMHCATDLHIQFLQFLHRPGWCMPFDDFRRAVPGVHDPGGQPGLLITYAAGVDTELVDLGVPRYAGWYITRDGVTPLPVLVEPSVVGMTQLERTWPVKALGRSRVMVVGVGSIGGAAAEALANYGVGTIDLVDPDRFLWHNSVRHVLGDESVGAFKVNAMKRRLSARQPWTEVHPHRLDVTTNAHTIRDLLADTDLVLCCADGIGPRRVVSHLARRAAVPAVLACVLDDGAVGEVLRLRPAPNVGCLLCQRKYLELSEGIDPEAMQEREYGTGSAHRPMTAVGSDLHLIGQLAAKVAVATLLEIDHGDPTQLLPGDQAVVGLRPGGDLAAPYAVTRAATIDWFDIGRPRTECPTCNPG